MVPEVVLSPEGLVADVTGVRPLVRVGSLVDEQVVRLGEMPPAELANKFLFSLGREPAPCGLSVRGQLAQLRDRAPQSRGQLGQIGGFRWVLLRCGQGQIGEVKPRPVFVQRLYAVRAQPLFGVKELGSCKRQRGEGDPRVHKPLRSRHLCDCGA